MPAQATQTEEENLIILDDVISEPSTEIKIEEPTSSEELIDFGNENNNNSLDLGDFSLDNSEKSEITTVEKEKKVPVVISDEVEEVDLGLGNISIEETDNLLSKGVQDDYKGSTSGSFIQDDSSDLNSILDETIVKLQSRSDIISENKIIEQDNIKDFKSQISILENSVVVSELVVSDLNKESLKIRSNIKSLERMKLKDEVEEVKKETSTKVHNSKRGR